jgi:putative transposase
MKTPRYEPAGYDTDLNDAEWELIEPFLYPAGAKRGRGRRREPHAARASLDAIRYVLKAGCQWSLLPKEFPPKSTVHDALAAWTRQGVWPRINTALRERVRVETLKKTPRPAPGSSTARASRAGNSPPRAAATTRARRSKGASAIR